MFDRKIIFVQFGNYADGYNMVQANGEETYFGQAYTIDYLTQLVKRGCSVTVIAFGADRCRETLPNGVVSIGIDLYPSKGFSKVKELLSLIEEQKPTDLIVNIPLRPIFVWGLRNRVRTLALFADSFPRSGFRNRIKNWLLARVLNKDKIPWVSNHNIASSLDLRRIGVRSSKILPYDWPEIVTAEQFEARSIRTVSEKLRILYVGSLVVSKGVADAITAVSHCIKAGEFVELGLIGIGDRKLFEKQVHSLGMGKYISFLGRRAHRDLINIMHKYDVVVVPSHHDYPEGIPMTIYEGLCTGAPVVVSDHPMFSLRIRDDREGLVYPEKNTKALAQCFIRLKNDSDLYMRLSNNAKKRAKDYLCPLKWHVLLNRWFDCSDKATDELASYSLSSGRYEV